MAENLNELAAKFGLTLCDFCEQPMERHAGFDHGSGKCLLAGDGISMAFRFPKRDERHDVINRINAYYEMLEVIENSGAGI